MTKLKHLISIITFMLLTVVAASASAEITLSLDRTDIHENETFHLRVQVEESNTLNAGAGVNFIPEEITIRGRQEYNSSIIVNGQYNTQMGWDFELLATEAGTYTIPPLSIGNERSDAFTIRILPQQDDIGDASNAKIKLRANLSDEEVYVQQQLLFTVRIYRSVVARNQNITPIRVTNALVEQLGENKTFDVVKEGNNFRVVEQRYAIFPQQSGEMVIEPMTYSATVLEESEGRSPWQRSQLKPISLSTQKYTVNVKPKPQNALEPWLPAKKLELEAEWQPKNQTFRVGDPANLDLIIKGTGLLTTQLPTVTFPEEDGVTIYRDTPQYRQRINRFGVNSYHFEKIAVIPNKSGEITIPEVKVPWWNVTTDQQEYATLPAQTIRVEQSSQQINNNQPQTVIPEAQKQAMRPDAGPANNQDTSATDSTYDYWKYITFALAAMWLVTLVLFLRQKSQSRSLIPQDRDATNEQLRQGPHSTLREAIAAAKVNDAKSTIQHLASWLKNDSSPAHLVNVTQLIRYCREHQYQALAEELEMLQSVCYSAQSNQKQPRQWKGRELAKHLSGFKTDDQERPANKLPQLYDKR